MGPRLLYRGRTGSVFHLNLDEEGEGGEGTKIKDSQRDPNKQLPDLKIHREEKQVFYGITCRIAARVNRAVWGILHRITADDF